MMGAWTVLALLAQLALARAGHDVPVMLWCHNCSVNIINPLHKTSTVEFEKFLTEKLGKTQPPTVVFVKDNFCVEDVKHHQQSLQNLNSSGSLTFLTLVDSALSVFQRLPHNITDEDDVNSINEGQLAIVPINDLNSLPDKYSILKDSSPNLVVALTGNSCIYTSSTERIKRAANFDAVGNATSKVLFHIDEVPSIKFHDSEKYISLGNETSRSTNADEKTYNLTINYGKTGDISKITLKAHFNKSNGYFKFLGIDYTPNGDAEKTVYLKSKSNIEFPYNFGYHCGQDSVFSQKHKNSTTEEEISIILKNLQVQMDVDQFSAQIYDCVGFMSIPIWTGIFVTAILALILIWGLMMIMDIRTMDRFDDPKGKTITVSAQE